MKPSKGRNQMASLSTQKSNTRIIIQVYWDTSGDCLKYEISLMDSTSDVNFPSCTSMNHTEMLFGNPGHPTKSYSISLFKAIFSSHKLVSSRVVLDVSCVRVDLLCDTVTFVIPISKKTNGKWKAEFIRLNLSQVHTSHEV